MGRLQHRESNPRLEVKVGDVGDTPDLVEELTPDDIDDIALDAYMSIKDRRKLLMNLLAEFRTRRSVDYAGDMDEIALHLYDRIAALGDRLKI